MQKKFEFISDPGHGWVKVSLHTLWDLRIVDQITPCSYMRKGFAYLEEDCDGSRFVQEYVRKHGERPVLVDRCCRDRYSRIRGYEGYTPKAAKDWLFLNNGSYATTVLSSSLIQLGKMEIVHVGN